MMGEQTPAARLLARHAERRRQGLATVSVLAGPGADAVWRQHGGPEPLAVDPASAVDPARLAAAVLAAVCGSVPLLSLAVAHLGRRLGRPAGEVLAGRSPHDLDQMWRALADAGGDDLDLAMRVVCTEPAERWADALAAALPGWQSVAAIGRLLGDGGRRPPPLWLAVGDDPGWLSGAAEPLAGLATAVPRWPVGVGVSSGAAAAFRSTATASRADTLLAAGLVDVPPVATPTVARAVRPAARADDPARSETERRLFALLQARWPGLFALNRPLGFRFGRRPAEADLLAADLRLVVEVDGYHHFTDREPYRRDRRKDWLYQTHRYRCRRVLATDVWDRPAAVLDVIAEAVDDCRRHLSGDGPTGTL